MSKSLYEDYLKNKQFIANRQIIEDDCHELQKKIKDLYKKCNSIKTKILIIFNTRNKNINGGIFNG